MKAARKSNNTSTQTCPCNGYPLLSRGAIAFDTTAWQLLQKSLRLSPRELQITQRIFDDKLEYVIALELGVSINTIHTETRRLRTKLNAPDRLSLVLLVTEEYLRLTASSGSDLPAICHHASAGRCPLPKEAAPAKR